jgi:hypothetical protein
MALGLGQRWSVKNYSFEGTTPESLLKLNFKAGRRFGCRSAAPLVRPKTAWLRGRGTNAEDGVPGNGVGLVDEPWAELGAALRYSLKPWP